MHVHTEESLLMSRVIQLVQSDLLLNVLSWNKHWLVSNPVLEPSQQV